jgi:CHAD domain-containing protein
MAYRIRPDKSFDAEVRAAARAQLEKAIAVLQDRPDGLHEAIHTARKHLKRTRSLYRLAVAHVAEFYEQENKRLQGVAKSLAVFRDATALVEIGKYLHETATSQDEASALARVADTLAARRDWVARAETDIEAKTAAAIETCGDALRALDDASFKDHKGDVAGLLKKSWRKTSQKAVTALTTCRTEAHTDQFHELRKRCQNYWMYHALLRDLWPSAMYAKQVEAKALVDILGRYHDLAALSEVVNRERDLFTASDDQARLLEAIISRQQLARSASLEKARHVFSDNPDDESKMIERLWCGARR